MNEQLEEKQAENRKECSLEDIKHRHQHDSGTCSNRDNISCQAKVDNVEKDMKKKTFYFSEGQKSKVWTQVDQKDKDVRLCCLDILLK